jgi:hypothetical protein
LYIHRASGTFSKIVGTFFLKTNKKISSYCQFALNSKVEIERELVRHIKRAVGKYFFRKIVSTSF